MNDQSGSARFQLLFEDSLQEYEKQTDIALVKHPLAERLLHCDSVESVSAILEEQVCAHSEFQDSERIIKSLNSTVSFLSIPSASVNLGLVRPKVLMECLMSLILILKPFPLGKAIYAGFSVLLAACLFPLLIRAYLCNTLAFQTVKDVSVCGLLVDLLESIESFLKRLDIYTKITPTVAMTETVVKTLVELISILALATKFIKQGQPGKFLLANGLPNSMQPREICKEAFWQEVRWDGAGKAGSTHPGRGSNDCSAGSRGRLWSCPKYKGDHGWWAIGPGLPSAG